MIPDGLITYSTQQIEDMAARHLKCRPDIEISPPINLEKLIEYVPERIILEIRPELAPSIGAKGASARNHLAVG